MQTLAQLLNDNQLPVVEIKDYPSVRFRGVVEGFYGTPWSHEARLRQLKFYGENKMNTYIYGPKDDPYHSSPNWRLPYPEKEALQLQELVKVANENEVDFVWAIHPGQDIKWNQEDRDLLLAKFEKMYDLGVRSFAVFFDDISGEGTNPNKQAELLNYIDEKFVKVKPDVTPLVMCPTEYNKSWSNPKGNYLTTLGEKLNPSIQIMWTGDRVISDINQRRHSLDQRTHQTSGVYLVELSGIRLRTRPSFTRTGLWQRHADCRSDVRLCHQSHGTCRSIQNCNLQCSRLCMES